MHSAIRNPERSPFNRTFKELKFKNICCHKRQRCTFNRTFKELKLKENEITPARMSKLLIAPLRN